ncbi:MAG TPA: acetyl-CoA C-acyltransferase [Acidimicrobiales bacterium]|nr:acetyl-CoA C-acyltransferase [Acidimicrobiales bacterium]
MADVWIVDAVRTPIGRYGGALASRRPDDLAALACRALVERHGDLDPARIDDVFFGDANGAGEDNRNVARMAVLLAGFPPSVPGVTLNRLCGSGMEAVIEASRAVASEDASLCLAGGVESMSRAPWVLPKPDTGYSRAHETLWSSTLGWRMVNPAMRPEWTVALGEGAELLADRYSISREDQDRFALGSHQRAAAAHDAGEFGDELVGLDELELDRDESIRPTTTLERLGSLAPAFRPDGSVTAGNSSPLNDGAAAMLLADRAGLEAVGAEPLARIASRAVCGVEPQYFGIGPVAASRDALKRAGVGWGDLSCIELNEAFAAQSLACLAEWPDLDPSLVNPQGGAIALGHPLGCSGARLLVTLAWRLWRTGGRWGLATMCIGVGQGIAVVLERAGGSS